MPARKDNVVVVVIVVIAVVIVVIAVVIVVIFVVIVIVVFVWEGVKTGTELLENEEWFIGRWSNPAISIR